MSSPASTVVASTRFDTEPLDPTQLWQRILSRLQLHAEQAHFDTYLRGTRGVAYDPGASVIRVAVSNPFHIPWLEGKLSPLIHAVVADLLGSPIRVEFCPGQDPPDATLQARRPRPAPLLAQLEATRPQTPPLIDHYSPSEPTGRPRTNGQFTAGSPLNARYTFDSFVVGHSNRLAHAASLAVVDRPGNAYNPLFLYGGVGLGKTHLLHAIGHAIAATGSDVLYVSSETFTNELIEAIRQRRTDHFRLKYRTARVLLIDDVQFIAGKESTEEEVFHTFNAIHESGGQLVLSSDRAPRAMAILEDRLRSRFEWGLTADIQAPDYETRIAILRSKLSTAVIGSVPSDVLDFIAEKVQSNIRELEGSLNRLLAHARHMQQPVTVELAARALRDLVAPGPSGRNVTPAAILFAVGRYYGVNSDELKGKSRHKHVVGPRQIAMYLLREDAHLSTPDIGRLLNRDHTTVLHGVKLISGDIARDGPSRAAIRGVREVIAAGSVQMPTSSGEDVDG
ncbi:MAG: chromosomal replication initiator protein DnaA [Chloroflexi bacterium]|nr:chromosomal replication initiator protein DnaA [Chloroflexota bacterium]MBV9894570.1 chromosomal replication initiator protein DnaA [Chloroflexota bacterium]